MALAIVTGLPAYAAAQQSPKLKSEASVDFDIPSGDLSAALDRFSAQSGIQILYQQELVAGKRMSSVRGTLSPAAALAQMLAGTGLIFERANEKTYVVKQRDAKPATKVREPKPTAESQTDGDAQRESVTGLDDIVVVGSRLGISLAESAMPVRVITREDIDRSGAGSIAQVLSQLSEVSISNEGDTVIGAAGGIGTGGVGGLNAVGYNQTNSATVQLRGLPLGTTLVLINGRRTGGSSSLMASGQLDLSTIPLGMVERIEVLPAGASAIHGGDGLAGVVNVVLRKDADGFSIRARRDVAEGYGESQGSVTWGRSWEKGSLMASATWRKNSQLHSSERDLTADSDYRRFGGPDRRFPAKNPAVVYSLEGCDLSIGYCNVPLESRGNLPGLDSPVASVPEGQNGVGLTPDDFRATEGMRRVARDYPLVTPEESKSFSLAGTLQVGEKSELVGEFMYSKRELPAAQLSLNICCGEMGFSDSFVRASNPHNPFGVDVGVDYEFKETGLFREFDQSFWRALIGLQGRVGRWDYDVSFWRSADTSSTGENFALRTTPSVLSSSDPELALNPFVGDGSAPGSDELISSLLFKGDNGSSLRVSGASAFIRGDIGTLPAGRVIGLVGAEHQRTDIAQWLELLPDDETSGGDETSAFFAEARIPVLGGGRASGAEKLALTGAFRSESSDRTAERANTKLLGLEFRPLTSLMLRATYSTAFKPLTVYSSLLRPSFDPCCLTVQDPQFDGQTYYVGLFGGGGLPPGLKPETSVNRTFGLVFSPENWRVALTHWSIDLQDRLFNVGYFDLQLFVDQEDRMPGRVVRDPQTGRIIMLDARPININFTETSGVDIALDGRVRSRYGYFLPALAATYVAKHRERLTEVSPEMNNLGIKRYTSWSPKWKVVPKISWVSDQGASATLLGRYVSSYEDPTPLETGPTAGTTQHLGNFWTIDLNVEIPLRKYGAWLGGADMALSVGSTNLLNRSPDYCNSCSYTYGYDSHQYQIMGRKLYLEVRADF